VHASGAFGDVVIGSSPNYLGLWRFLVRSHAGGEIMDWKAIAADPHLVPRPQSILSGIITATWYSDKRVISFLCGLNSADTGIYLKRWLGQIHSPAYVERQAGRTLEESEVFVKHDPEAALETFEQSRLREDFEFIEALNRTPFPSQDSPEGRVARDMWTEAIPLLNDPSSQHKRELLRIAVEAATRLLVRTDVGKTRDFDQWFWEYAEICSGIMRWKWEIGCGETYLTPDPSEFSHPRTPKSWRLEWLWMSEVMPFLRDQVSEELGLRFHTAGSWSSNSGIPEERAREEFKQYMDSGDWSRDHETILNEMSERGMTYESFFTQNEYRYPEAGQFSSLVEILEEMGIDWDSKSAAELHVELGDEMSKVFEEYYNCKAFVDNLDSELGLFTETINERFARQLLARNSRVPSYGLLERIEGIIHKTTVSVLVREFGEGESGWWVQGVPENIRVECQARREADPDRSDPESYLTLVNVKQIIEKNWSLFVSRFNARVWGGEQRRGRLSAFDTLNAIRNRVMHPLRRGVSIEEFELLRDLANHLDSESG
jgi:hypothetical protein